MRLNSCRFVFSTRLITSSMALLCALPLLGHARLERDINSLRTVIVGGGPSLEYNQVAIESNVRYVQKLLPPKGGRTTLFADGNLNSPTVLTDIDIRKLPESERLLRLLLEDRDALAISPTQYRKPNLVGQLDGATKPSTLRRVFGKLAEEADKDPKMHLFLYFTGHGSSDRQSNENNIFDMWGEEAFTVRDLSKQVARLPANVPITLIMVQCHSGSFANLLFEGGDPKADIVDRDVVGFFATIKERPAAGCTSEVNEAEYRDFTSYFFAALTGQDRLGRRVIGADYNRNGRIGMDEAFCYTLIHDRSIDIPICTSDIFLRRFVPHTDTEVFRAQYSDVLDWATSGQRAALLALAKTLGRESGEDRLAVAYQDMTRGFYRLGANDPGDSTQQQLALRRDYKSARERARQRLFARFPEIEKEMEPRNRMQARRYLEADRENEVWGHLLKTADTLNRLETDSEKREVAESHLIRFVRLGKSIILAHRLREGNNRILKDRFERLVQGEASTLLPPARD